MLERRKDLQRNNLHISMFIEMRIGTVNSENRSYNLLKSSYFVTMEEFNIPNPIKGIDVCKQGFNLFRCLSLT